MTEAAASPSDAAASTVATKEETPKAGNGVELITTPDGELMGFSISPAQQLYTMVDRLTGMQRIVALPIAERFALAGKVAAVPDEHKRLVEKLASTVATSMTESGALNALYLLEACRELVPGFKDLVPEGRLEQAAELSTHERVKAAVLKGERPKEWEEAAKRTAEAQIVVIPRGTPGQEEEDGGLLDDAGAVVEDAGRMVGDGARFVGGAAFGGVGLIADTLGITDNAEGELAATAEDAVDLVGDGVNAVVDTVGDGINGLSRDIDLLGDELAEKGVINTVGDATLDAVDMVTDFVGAAFTGIGGLTQDALSWAAGDDDDDGPDLTTHKVAIVVADLFGEERSLGLRIENRVVTGFTKPEAESLGWKLGDCIAGVGMTHVTTQEDMLAAIGAGKEALKSSGAQLKFLVERMGPRPVQPGSIINVQGKAAQVQGMNPDGSLVVRFQDGTQALVRQ